METKKPWIGPKSLIWLVFLAAAPAFTAHAPNPFPHEVKSCQDRFDQVSFTAGFQLPNSNPMKLFLGHERNSKQTATIVLADAKTESCQAVCKVVAFDRYRHDFHPASLELTCRGAGFEALTMPATIQWVKYRGQKDYQALLRVGSSLIEVHEAKLNIVKDDYTPVKVAQWAKR